MPPPRRAFRPFAGFTIITGLLLATIGHANGFGPSLDEIYRDSLRLENGGALPRYVTNRGPRPYPEVKPPPTGTTAPRAVPLVEAPTTEPLPWQRALQEITDGFPGPQAVEAVRERAERSDPEGLELLAWMYANGIGVRKDLRHSFSLYIQSSHLDVNGARKNAEAIYRAMSVADRQAVFDPFL